MIEEKSKEKVSRRRFLKGAAVAAPGVAAAGAWNAWGQSATKAPRKWDKEADVVILGTGFAGLSAAITAKDAGAEVIILEKMPPFYCIKLYPATYNTQGGPRRNAQCRIVDPDNQPIPRLYSAGELGSFWGWMYNGGGNNAEALCTGQIAGRNAAAEKPLRKAG